MSEAADPRYGGRLHVLAAVPPERLLDWVVDADVGRHADPDLHAEPLPVHAEQAVRMPGGGRAGGRERLPGDAPDRAWTTPTVRWACSAGPTIRPTSRAGIRDDPRPARPDAKADLRRRCLQAAHERWNWETESQRLLALYADLTRAAARSRRRPPRRRGGARDGAATPTPSSAARRARPADHGRVRFADLSHRERARRARSRRHGAGAVAAGSAGGRAASGGLPDPAGQGVGRRRACRCRDPCTG